MKILVILPFNIMEINTIMFIQTLAKMKNMNRKIILLTLFSIYGLNAQIQISNFTYNNINSSPPVKLQEFNNQIFFSAVTDDYGRELWSSDGTSLNTNLFYDFANGVSNGLPTFFSESLNGELYFNANDGFNYSGGEIWKTNGTKSGTKLVVNYNGRLYGLTKVGSLIYMAILTDSTTLEIWKTDGTESGTVLVKENIPTNGYPKYQGSINNKFIFTINTPSTGGSKVWCSDGTNEGTYALTSVLDGNGSTGSTSELSQYIKFNNKLYFITRNFLYQTDGTLSGTNQIANVRDPQTSIADFGDVIELNGKIYFSFFSKELNKLSIYESDGTPNNTSKIYTITSSKYFYPSYFGASGNNLIFSSVNSNNGTSLFYMDTNSNLTSEIIEIDSNPTEPIIFFGVDSALTITNIDGNNFFLNSPKETWPQKRGGIFNETDISYTHVPSLDNIYDHAGRKIIYNNDLYYSKDNQLWKFDTNTLSSNSFDFNQKIKFFPNPTSNYIYFNSPNRVNKIIIHDLNGKIVLKKNKLTTNSINIKHLPIGIYTSKIIDINNKITTKKIIKK
ncbi:T9SS type A sorting domain-containing protein [Tenacibaculum sp. 190524A02b]|uniref:T9SS type A sorting domain-containing protein n=1 Tax=Tenacibaculum vairaonense TaxID=3137860 RepID=UPI0031FB4EFB